MLSFSANMKVVGNSEEKVSIGDYEYNVYTIKTGQLEMRALFSVKLNVKVGMCLTSSSVFLTNINGENYEDSNELLLRVENFTQVDEKDFDLGEFLEVRVNAKVFKSEKSVLKTIGVTKKNFMSCYVRVKNEENKMFYILLVSFNKLALALNDIPNYSYVNIVARLNQKIDNPGVYELNASKIELVNKNN